MPDGTQSPILTLRSDPIRIDKQADIDRWIKPDGPEVQPEPGYEEWLEAEIAAGIAELDAGKGIPAAEVWKSLGLE